MIIIGGCYGLYAFECNYSGGCKAMYRTLLEGVWLSDIGRMAEVRNVPHLAWCEYRVVLIGYI